MNAWMRGCSGGDPLPDDSPLPKGSSPPKCGSMSWRCRWLILAVICSPKIGPRALPLNLGGSSGCLPLLWSVLEVIRSPMAALIQEAAARPMFESDILVLNVLWCGEEMHMALAMWRFLWVKGAETRGRGPST